MERLEQVLDATAAVAESRSQGQRRINGRPIKVVDCSTTQLSDTAENQNRYPQPSSQKPRCGFPLMRFLTFYSMGSGAIAPRSQPIIGKIMTCGF